jgi:uncharacterized protein (TIGR02145 family)
MSSIRIIFLLTVILSGKGCTSSNKSSLLCDCEKKHNGQFLGFTQCERFNNINFEGGIQSDENSHSGKYSVKLTDNSPFGITFLIKNVQAKECFRISAWRHSTDNKGCIVASCDNIDDLYLVQDKQYRIEGDWHFIFFDFVVPSSADGKEIKVYVWKEFSKAPVFFDDLKIEYLSREVKRSHNLTSILLDNRDGQQYSTVKIGTNWWMSQNLNYAIGNSRCYEDSSVNCNKFGKLYNYQSAIIACPKGWRLPSDDDWKDLERFLGMNEVEISKYGERGYIESFHLREYGSSGFNAKLTGAFQGGFYNLHREALFWTSTEIDSLNAYSRVISHHLTLGRFKDNKSMHFCIRCIQIRN